LPSSMKQGAISAAMALSLTASESSEANAASAIPASCADPTRLWYTHGQRLPRCRAPIPACSWRRRMPA
jgi:hypothetical protein